MGKLISYSDEGLLKRKGGNKVGWRWYATEEQANTCAEAAFANAEVCREWGYEFGYCSPGSVIKTDEGWQVCIP